MTRQPDEGQDEARTRTADVAVVAAYALLLIGATLSAAIAASA